MHLCLHLNPFFSIRGRIWVACITSCGPPRAPPFPFFHNPISLPFLSLPHFCSQESPSSLSTVLRSTFFWRAYLPPNPDSLTPFPRWRSRCGPLSSPFHVRGFPSHDPSRGTLAPLLPRVFSYFFLWEVRFFTLPRTKR